LHRDDRSSEKKLCPSRDYLRWTKPKKKSYAPRSGTWTTLYREANHEELRMRLNWCIALILFCVVLLQAVEQKPMLVKSPELGSFELTPENVADQIKKHGAHMVVGDLYQEHDTWNNFMQKISTGQPKWLMVAGLLQDGIDVGAAEEWNLAMGHALQYQPEKVLRIVDPKWRQGVCWVGGYDETPSSDAETSQRARLTRKAVLGVQALDLKQAIRECAGSLSKSEAAAADTIKKGNPASR
jgi:hypothetical protein